MAEATIAEVTIAVAMTVVAMTVGRAAAMMAPAMIMDVVTAAMGRMTVQATITAAAMVGMARMTA